MIQDQPSWYKGILRPANRPQRGNTIRNQYRPCLRPRLTRPQPSSRCKGLFPFADPGKNRVGERPRERWRHTERGSVASSDCVSLLILLLTRQLSDGETSDTLRKE